MKIIARKQAMAAGLKRYFTGEPCKHGHVCERTVLRSDCVECLKLRQTATRAKGSSEPRRAATDGQMWKGRPEGRPNTRRAPVKKKPRRNGAVSPVALKRGTRSDLMPE